MPAGAVVFHFITASLKFSRHLSRHLVLALPAHPTSVFECWVFTLGFIRSPCLLPPELPAAAGWDGLGGSAIEQHQDVNKNKHRAKCQTWRLVRKWRSLVVFAAGYMKCSVCSGPAQDRGGTPRRGWALLVVPHEEPQAVMLWGLWENGDVTTFMHSTRKPSEGSVWCWWVGGWLCPSGVLVPHRVMLSLEAALWGVGTSFGPLIFEYRSRGSTVVPRSCREGFAHRQLPCAPCWEQAVC